MTLALTLNPHPHPHPDQVLDSAQAMPIEELQEGVLDETQLNRLVASIAKVAVSQ